MSTSRSRPPAQPVFVRTALAPGLLGAIVVLAGLALIGSDWYLAVRYIVSVIAVIVCVYAVQGRQWWWLVVLVPIAVLWNPVVPLSLSDLFIRLASVLAAAALVVVGLSVKVPERAPRR